MHLIRFIVLFLLLFVISIPANAQIPESSPPPIIVSDDEIIKIESRLVIVPVSVLNPSGQPVLGLKAENFRILENNRTQQIAEVSEAEKIPLEIAILFDISATTNPMFEFQQETAIRFLRDVMRAEDRATIITVGNSATIIQPRDTASKSAESIRMIRASKEQTAFYDSLVSASDYLSKNSPTGRRKVVIIISDGEDTNSAGVIRAIWNAERKLVDNKISAKDLRTVRVQARDDAKLKEQAKVLKSLQNADAVFYSINPAGSSYQLNKMSVFGQSNMQKFADETGGTAFLPKFLPIDVPDVYQKESNTRRNSETLEGIFRQLANELRAQYLIQYYSDSEYPMNRYVDLDVGLTASQPFRIRARKGYFVKNGN